MLSGQLILASSVHGGVINNMKYDVYIQHDMMLEGNDSCFHTHEDSAFFQIFIIASFTGKPVGNSFVGREFRCFIYLSRLYTNVPFMGQ